MEVIDVIFEEDRSKEAFAKYFKYERQRGLKQVPILLIAIVCSSMIILGLLFKIDILWILGLVSAAVAAVYLLIYFLRFQIVINKYFNEFDKKAKTADKEFQFSFDSECIKYNSKNLNSEIKWPMIKSYFINGEDIYLYLANRELLDIISEEILGSEKFAKFKALLNEKVTMPNNS